MAELDGMERTLTDQQVTAADLRDRTDWPRFTAHTLDTGYRSVHAVPQRLRDETIGALNLFGRPA